MTEEYMKKGNEEQMSSFVNRIQKYGSPDVSILYKEVPVARHEPSDDPLSMRYTVTLKSGGQSCRVYAGTARIMNSRKTAEVESKMRNEVKHAFEFMKSNGLEKRITIMGEEPELMLKVLG